MGRLAIILSGAALVSCANTPLPEHNAQTAWVDMFTHSGRLVMAERLDGQKTTDGRYFQLTPGSHELIVRFDYELLAGLMTREPIERTCYITLRYDGFKAGERYRLEGRAISTQASARLFDAQRQIVAEDRDIRCI